MQKDDQDAKDDDWRAQYQYNSIVNLRSDAEVLASESVGSGFENANQNETNL